MVQGTGPVRVGGDEGLPMAPSEIPGGERRTIFGISSAPRMRSVEGVGKC